MSAQAPIKRNTVPQIQARKGGEPVVCLTAYTAPMAKMLDPHVDLLLVGDSLGMVMHGLENTVGVSLDMMILHGQSVMRGAQKALVVVDMPFGTYEESPEAAYRNAVRVMKETGCQAVKLEGGRYMAETIAFLTARGIPVMAHIGLTPQAVQVTGGFKAKGRSRDEWEPIKADIMAVAEAGAFSVVMEGVAGPLAQELTKMCPIPTIGIGASNVCDGQILVTEDMLGIGEWVPKFVRRFAELGPAIDRAAAEYAAEVKARSFPGPENTYQMRKGEE